MLSFMIKTVFFISGGLIAYSYIVYPVLLIILDKARDTTILNYSGDLPKVSVIIAAYNEEKVIDKRIENLLSLDYPKDSLEIIIASDGSDDGTNEILGRVEDGRVTVEVFSERRGKVNVLNDVVPKAKHNIVVFSDANTAFEKDALKKLVRHFGDEKVGCVCGLLKFVSVEGSTSGELEGAYWRYETMLKKLEGVRGSLLGANGAIFALRKNLFFKCPENTIVEDFVVPMKILEKGFKVIYEPEAIAIEDAAKHIIQEKQRRIRIGAGDFQALTMLAGMLNPKKGFVALSFWSHKVLRWFAWGFMAAAFLANALLLNEPFYGYVFIVQVIFYMCALAGQMLSWAGIQIKFFNLCYYFVSMNLALFLGFINFISGRHTVKWNRTER